MQHIQKCLTTFIVTLFFAIWADAVPATGRLYGVFTTEKGESLSVRLMGDEHLSCWQSDDGRCFHLNASNQLQEISATEVQARRVMRLVPQRTPSLGDFKHYEGAYKGIIILADFTDRQFG